MTLTTRPSLATLAALVALPTLVMVACAEPAAQRADSNIDLDGWIAFQDGGLETAPDAAPDDAPGDAPGGDTAPSACQAKTADGIALNPGCDPDVQASGVSALDMVNLGSGSSWLVLAGKKWWNLDLAQGGFTDGGKDLSTFLKKLQPGCQAKTSDGIALNPGCDQTVQVNGVTALGNLTTSSNTLWVLTSGTRWWTYSSASAAFVQGGKSFGGFLRTFAPGCTAKTTDGIALNPGCDPDVTAKGVSAIDIITLSGKTSWMVMIGAKWWTFDQSAGSGAGAFTQGGKSFSTYLKGLLPDCTALTPDGSPLNPGCDADVQVNGVTAIGSMTLNGATSWYVSSGKKWWSYDLTMAAFSAGSKDVAAFFRSMKP